MEEAVKFQPLNGRVLIEAYEPEDKTESGIIIPSQAQDEVIDGLVRAVWQMTDKDKEEKNSPAVAVGDHVVFPKFSGSDVRIDGVAYRVMYESDLHGMFNA